MSDIREKLKDVFKSTEFRHNLKCNKDPNSNRVICMHTMVAVGDKGKDIPPIVKGKIELEDTGDAYEPNKRGGLELFGKSDEELDAEFEFLKQIIPRHLSKNLNKPVRLGDR